MEYLLYYLYDENGAPIGLQYRTSDYASGIFDFFFFDKNLQGDVIGIYNADGEKICTYTYDAWGICNIALTSGISSLERNVAVTYNPFRYRGYYYDTETGLYYLQSRYYNPEWGRFINADDYVNPNGDLLGFNMFAYCGNNPVNRNDDGGMFWDTIFDVVSLAMSVAEVVSNPADPWAWAGLVGDAIDLIPFVSGVGEVTRAIKTVDKITDAVDDVHDAAKAVDNAGDAIGTYKDLKKLNKGSGLEVHHIVEKRFAPSISPNLKQNDMLSIALDHGQHGIFTNKWRQKLPYGKTYSKESIWSAAQEIYADYPSLLEAARKTIWGN